MAIPNFQVLMLPLLRFASDNKVHRTSEAVEVLASEFKLSQEERKQLLASGQQAVFNNRIGWASCYLKKAGLLESPRPGTLRITVRGTQILGDSPSSIDGKFLERFPGFIEFRDMPRNNKKVEVKQSVELCSWRDAAVADSVSRFVKAWMPFNAWMVDTFGELTERQLLDRLIAGNNLVFNQIVPMLDLAEDRSQDAAEFRLQLAELHRLLQACVIEGRSGRVSFERVDVGENTHTHEQRLFRGFAFTARRNHPVKPQVLVEIKNRAAKVIFHLAQPGFNREALEADQALGGLASWQRSKLLLCYESVRPRLIESVLAISGARTAFRYGDTYFIDDPRKIFKALIDVVSEVRNALFHDAINPNQHYYEIYGPACRVVMRLVKCTK